MKFLIDTNLPKALAAWIRENGLEADHALDLGIAKAPDTEIWRVAEASGFVIVSKDEDFATMSLNSQAGPAVVWIRTGNGTTAELIAFLMPLWAEIVTRLEANDRLIEVR